MNGKAKASDWPATIRHRGEVYTKTGKTGRNERTGCPSAEYELVRRVWLIHGGEIDDEGAGRGALPLSDRESVALSAILQSFIEDPRESVTETELVARALLRRVDPEAAQALPPAAVDGDLEQRIAKLSRERVVEILGRASIQCHENETDNELREALLVNLQDGTIDGDTLDAEEG